MRSNRARISRDHGITTCPQAFEKFACVGLIEGEAYPPYAGGLARYVTLKNAALKKKLPPFLL